MGQWPDSRSLANYPKCEITVAIGPHILSSHGQGVQTIQQGIPSGCSNGQIAAARAECQAVHIAQWAAGGGPILEHCEARQVHQTQRILSHAARHCQDLHAALSHSLSSSKTKTHWMQFIPRAPSCCGDRSIWWNYIHTTHLPSGTANLP